MHLHMDKLQYHEPMHFYIMDHENSSRLCYFIWIIVLV